MTETEFFRNALLQIASNSAFGNDWRGDKWSMAEWAADIEKAATALLDTAIENQCVTTDEPKRKQPP